jgi:sugar phosphate isomerase/epimerase
VKKYPVSVQLYSLREQCAKDFVGVLKQVAAMGYQGVEPAGFFGLRLREAKSIIKDLGMVMSSSHRPWCTPDSISEAVEIAGVLGLKMLCAGFGPNDFKGMDEIKRAADKANAMCAGLKKHGLSLFLHNHWWEYAEINGRLGIDHLAELAPDVLFEIDTYWASNFGANDPAAQVAKFKNRTPLLHIKDGPLVKDQPHVAVGKGKMDIPKVVAAADSKVLKWLVVELDSCATDMTQAVADSHAYLVASGLGKERKPPAGASDGAGIPVAQPPLQ